LVSAGIDVFLGEGLWRRYIGKRLAVLSNAGSLTSRYTYSVEELRSRGLDVRAILVPEHGYWGYIQAGEPVEHGYDSNLGASVYSLYRACQEPVRKILEEVDTVVIDIQDLGLRFYTYLSTVLDLLDLVSSIGGREVLILDRPNPLGGVIAEGPIAKGEMISFVARYTVPVRYGATIAEIARLYDLEKGLGLDPVIVPLKGWKRELDAMDIDTPWAPPSPAIPTPDTVYPYSLTAYIEGTNMSEGRGTYTPFKVFGAPFIDPKSLSRALNEVVGDSGVVFRPVVFRPLFSKHRGSTCGGVYIHVVDRKRLRSFGASLKILKTVYTLYSEHVELLKVGDRFYIDMLYGDPRATRAITGLLELEDFISAVDGEIAEYMERLEQVIIYR